MSYKRTINGQQVGCIVLTLVRLQNGRGVGEEMPLESEVFDLSENDPCDSPELYGNSNLIRYWD